MAGEGAAQPAQQINSAWEYPVTATSVRVTLVGLL